MKTLSIEELQGEIEHLNYLCKTYDGIKKLIVSTKNRIQAINPDADPNHQDEIIVMESIKNKISRKIAKMLEYWPVWNEWLKNVPGIGPFVGGNLILLYYYRFIPVCPECGSNVEKEEGTFVCISCSKKLKGMGLLNLKIDQREFDTVSKWWAFMGRIVDVETGKLIRRKAGQQQRFSSRGKMIGYQIADQFNRRKEDHPYKAYMLKRKKHREKTHPDASKGHRHNMACNETIKLFLSHFWEVARELDGKPHDLKPYSIAIMKHTNYIAPYFWK